MSKRRREPPHMLLPERVICDQCKTEQQNRHITHGTRDAYAIGCVRCGHLVGTYAP